jgi:hypothetical protein
MRAGSRKGIHRGRPSPGRAQSASPIRDSPGRSLRSASSRCQSGTASPLGQSALPVRGGGPFERIRPRQSHGASAIARPRSGHSTEATPHTTPPPKTPRHSSFPPDDPAHEAPPDESTPAAPQTASPADNLPRGSAGNHPLCDEQHSVACLFPTSSNNIPHKHSASTSRHQHRRSDVASATSLQQQHAAPVNRMVPRAANVMTGSDSSGGTRRDRAPLSRVAPHPGYSRSQRQTVLF